MIAPDAVTPSETIEALVISAREIARTALELEKFVERAVQFPHVLVQLLGVDAEVDPAAATVAIRLSAQGADGVGQLLSTLRARHVDLLAVQAELAHRFGSLTGCDDCREPRVGGGEQTAPAEGGDA